MVATDAHFKHLRIMKPTLTYYDMADGVLAFSTTRHGGYSSGEYGEFNINRYCGDSEDATERNLRLLGKELGIETDRIIMPHQTHGTEVRHIAADFLTLPAEVRRLILEGVDAVTTNERGICVGVSTADCIPIIIYDEPTHAIAAVHAGWRGTVQCIVKRAVDAMRLTYGSNPTDMKAIVGPGISLAAFEVDEEVYEQFLSAGFDMEAISRRENKWHIDLPECNRRQLIDCGVSETRIIMSGICTYSRSADYFSARKLGVDSGRIYTAAMLLDKRA